MDSKNKQVRKDDMEGARQTIRFFETLLRASTDGIVITDVTQNIIIVNEAFCSFFGVSFRDVVETNLMIWLEQIDGDARQRWVDLEQQIHHERECLDVEFKLISNQEEKWLSVNASPLERISGEEKGVIISTWRDITGRKKAEKSLQRSEERFRSLTENTTDLNIIVDAKRIIKYINPAIKNTFDYSIEEVTGKSIFELIHPDNKQMVNKMIDQAIANVGKTITLDDFSARHRNGSWIYLSGNIIHMPDVASINGIVGNFKDITLRNQIEKEHIKKEKLQAILEIAGAICHEFNQPLQVVSGYCELLDENSSHDVETKNVINIMSEAIKKMGSLTRNLMNITQYKTKPYLKSKIVDIKSSSEEE